MPATIQNASDSELVQFAQQMLNSISADPAAFGLTAGFVADLTARLDTFRSDIAAQIQAQATARAKTAAKNASRDHLEELMRAGRNVTKAAGTPAAMIASLGLPAGNSKAPSTATVPIGSVDTSSRMRHVIAWTDAAATNTKRRPRGVIGCEIWVKIGDPPPGDDKDCRFLTIDAATPYIADFENDDVGKTAHYILRWRMRDGSVSAWSETISATITG
jgi:hypothetical protein